MRWGVPSRATPSPLSVSITMVLCGAGSSQQSYTLTIECKYNHGLCEATNEVAMGRISSRNDIINSSC